MYQQGIQQGQFSYASAIGLMKAVVSVTLVVTSNKIAHMLGDKACVLRKGRETWQNAL